VFYADGDEVRAGLGRINTNRNYLQGAGADPAALTLKTGQTILMRDGNLPGEKEFGLDGAVLQGGVSHFSQGAQFPPWADGAPAFNTVASVPLILKAPGTVSDTLRLDTSGFQLSNAAGEKIFDTTRQLVAVLHEWRGTINIQAHGVTTPAPVSTVIHVDEPINAACDIVMGWLEVTSSNARILTDKPIDFSASLDLWGTGKVLSVPYDHPLGGIAYTNIFYRRSSVVLNPKIENGRLKIIEQFYNEPLILGPDDTPATPAITVKVHLIACARTGGGF